MTQRNLTDQIVRGLPAPISGMSVVRDSKVRGFGVRVLPSGTRAFVLDYSANGRRHVFTIGKFGDFTTVGARAKAAELKAAIKFNKADPARENEEARRAPTVADLCERFKADHLPRLRASTRSDYERMIEYVLNSNWGLKGRVAAVKRADIEAVHKRITEGRHQESAKPAPVTANLFVALCSKLFNFAVDLEWIERNPASGVKRNPTQSRTRYLNGPEITSLTKALSRYPDQDVADLFRLLLMTGARRGETRSATWAQFDIKQGYWTKPSHATKQKKEHRVPLAAPVQALLAKRRAQADAELARLAIKELLSLTAAHYSATQIATGRQSIRRDGASIKSRSAHA
jgi:integrase